MDEFEFAVVRSSIIDTILHMDRLVERPVRSPRRRTINEVVVVWTRSSGLKVVVDVLLVSWRRAGIHEEASSLGGSSATCLVCSL